MSDFLAAMAAASRLRAEGVRKGSGEAKLPSRASSARPASPLQLSNAGFDLIAEAKLASPSEGRLVPVEDDLSTIVDLSMSFASSGAAALSVLTEPTRFAGELAHLEGVVGSVDVPVMRKDFLVDPIQVFEARASGAAGLLLIARILEPALLVEMTDLALDLGMFVLVELFDESDIDIASVVFDRDVLIGVNARDLTTLRVDSGRHARMAGELDMERPLVAESGINSVDDARRVAALGYRLALVGTALVCHHDPPRLARELLRAGRAARTAEGVA